MPWSHSVAMMLGVAIVAWLVLGNGLGKARLGLYGSAPIVAFAFELGFGIWCWWYYRGGKALLAAIVLFNLANLSMFTPAIPGPEQWLPHRPMMITTLIFAQIVVTLMVVGYLARLPDEAVSQSPAIPPPRVTS